MLARLSEVNAQHVVHRENLPLRVFNEEVL